MSNPTTPTRWYQGISNYQWLVLLVACLGWIFDVFEGQIFVASMREAMPSLLEGLPADEMGAQVNRWNNIALGFFLFGGALGGVVFGAISDRVGRSKTMIITILFYSLFTCVTAFAQAPWQMVALRFLVAMGVGGEWAVASAMVAEVMPTRSRPIMSSIFHASSVFGTLLAAAAGYYVVGNPDLGENAWRWGFAIGALPALLTVYIRWKLREPKQWQEMRERANSGDPQEKPGQVMDLFRGGNLRNTAIAVALSSIGLVTFWGVHIYGKNALLSNERTIILSENGLAAPGADAAAITATLEEPDNLQRMKRAEMLSMVLNTIGGGLGLVLFGTISQRLGRKGAFILYHAAAFVISAIMFQFFMEGNVSSGLLMLLLPIFGFFTLGMHAGYAVYFPELYPTRLRGTGSGFCFNMGRVATGIIILLAGWMQGAESQGGLGMTVKDTAQLLNWLYPLGIVCVWFAAETRGRDLLD